MHQATRVRFRGGDPLALTKRIQARRPGGWVITESLCVPLGSRSRRSESAHSYLDELRPVCEPIEPIITTVREAWSILWQAGLLIVLFVGIAWTGPIFAAVVLR